MQWLYWLEMHLLNKRCMSQMHMKLSYSMTAAFEHVSNAA